MQSSTTQALASPGRRDPDSRDQPSVMAVNVYAPYVLTALIQRPQRLIYLSSGIARGRIRRPERSQLDEPSMDWNPGVQRQQTARHDARIRGRPTVA